MTSTLDQPVKFTLFFSQYADRKQEKVATPKQIAAMIRDTTAREKAALPWIKLATFGDVRTDKNSLRHDANVLTVTGIEADYDAGLISFDVAKDRLIKQGLSAVLYTSPGNSVARPRWRVLCPLSAPVPPERRCPFMGRLNGLFGGIFARESWTLSQAYFFGSVQRNPNHRVVLTDGLTIDQHDDLTQVWIGEPAAIAKQHDDQPGEAREDADLIRRALTGEGYHVELCSLAGRYAARGLRSDTVVGILQGVMLSQPEDARDDRWRDRYESISDLVNSAIEKFQSDTAHARREVARVIRDLIVRGLPSDEIRREALAEADRQTLPHEVADQIAHWIARQIQRRQANGHARRF
jgi:Arc/MetJ-type ribon-helix-helix transcriptional regulator